MYLIQGKTYFGWKNMKVFILCFASFSPTHYSKNYYMFVHCHPRKRNRNQKLDLCVTRRKETGWDNGPELDQFSCSHGNGTVLLRFLVHFPYRPISGPVLDRFAGSTFSLNWGKSILKKSLKIDHFILSLKQTQNSPLAIQ